MRFSSLYRRAAQGLLVAALLTGGLAMAQAEPTINQIYATAQAGKLDQAQLMVQQVLISHPQSAKAHFVRAELYAREGKLERARESLATAEKIAPGLPFAKPQAVQALRAQVSGRKLSPSVSSGLSGEPSSATLSTPTPAVHSGSQSAGMYSTPAAPSSSSWGLPLLLAGGVTLAGYLFFRRRAPEPAPLGGTYVPQSGLSGSQTFGMGGGAGGGYAPPAGSGMGGRILGGVATGLAVGAGVMAAEALGRNLMGHSSSNADTGGRSNGNFSSNDYQSLDNASNPDMGGADFGINDDGGGWDSGGGGGSDWDN